MLILICGPPLSGKTFTAKKILKNIDAEILRTDKIRNEIFKSSNLEEVLKSKEPMKFNLERIFDREDKIPAKFQKMIWKQKERVYNVLFSRAKTLLSKGKNVIIEGTFYKKGLREIVYKIARETGNNVYLIYCTCPYDIIKERIEKRKMKPDDHSYAENMDIYLKIKNMFEECHTDNIPTIFYNTGTLEIKELNTEDSDKEELNLLISSIN